MDPFGRRKKGAEGYVLARYTGPDGGLGAYQAVRPPRKNPRAASLAATWGNLHAGFLTTIDDPKYYPTPEQPRKGAISAEPRVWETAEALRLPSPPMEEE